MALLKVIFEMIFEQRPDEARLRHINSIWRQFHVIVTARAVPCGGNSLGILRKWLDN